MNQVILNQESNQISQSQEQLVNKPEKKGFTDFHINGFTYVRAKNVRFVESGRGKGKYKQIHVRFAAFFFVDVIKTINGKEQISRAKKHVYFDVCATNQKTIDSLYQIWDAKSNPTHPFFFRVGDARIEAFDHEDKTTNVVKRCPVVRGRLLVLSEADKNVHENACLYAHGIANLNPKNIQIDTYSDQTKDVSVRYAAYHGEYSDLNRTLMSATVVSSEAAEIFEYALHCKDKFKEANIKLSFGFSVKNLLPRLFMAKDGNDKKTIETGTFDVDLTGLTFFKIGEKNWNPKDLARKIADKRKQQEAEKNVVSSKAA